MKHNFYLMLAALALVVSCDKSGSGDEPDNKGKLDYQYVYATIAATRTAAEGQNVSWQVGDVIYVHGNALDANFNEEAKYLMKNEEDIAEGRFTFNNMIRGKELTAIKSAEYTDGSIENLASQKPVAGKFPACLSGTADAEGKITMQHTTPYAKLSIKGGSESAVTLYKVEIIAECIANPADTIKLDITPNLTLNQNDEAVFYFLTSTVADKAVKCIAYDADGGYMEADLGQMSFEVGKITDLSIVYEPKTIVAGYPGTDIEPVKVLEVVGTQQKEVIWAPVFCGYSLEHPNGLLYQFGRAAGQPYYPASPSSAVCASGPVLDPEDALHYKNDTEPKDWYSGTALSAWPMSSKDAGYVEGKIANPCPTGWRVPTWDELNGLVQIGFDVTPTSPWGFSPGGGDDASKEAVLVTNGWVLKDNTDLFFGAAAYRTNKGQSYYIGSGDGVRVNIWSSNIGVDNSGYAICLMLSCDKGSDPVNTMKVQKKELGRAFGCRVRCVKE